MDWGRGREFYLYSSFLITVALFPFLLPKMPFPPLFCAEKCYVKIESSSSLDLCAERIHSPGCGLQ